MGATMSGRLGAVNAVDTVKMWQVSEKSTPAEYKASNTDGGTGRAEGNTDWSGSFQLYGHTPPVWPGDAFAFAGSIDGAVGCSGYAIVDSFDLVIDVEGAKIDSETINFSGNGALTKGVQVVTDVVVPNPPSGFYGGVSLADAVGGTFAPVSDVRQITLRVQAQNPAYVDSSTSGQTMRKPGNIDCTASFGVYLLDDFTNIFAVNTLKVIQIAVTASTYWEIAWVIFHEASGIEANMEAVNIVSATNNASWTGFSAGVKGYIKDPAGIYRWGAAPTP